MTAEFQLTHIGQKLTIPDVKERIEIKSDITLIGRNKIAADLFLDSSKNTGLISRMHARIIRTSKGNDYQYELCDTSLNGTYVNDFKIFGSVKLKPGDVIGFGHTRGAVLQAGDYAPQKDSEFLFKFERISPKRQESKEIKEKSHTSKETTRNEIPTTSYVSDILNKGSGDENVYKSPSNKNSTSFNIGNNSKSHTSPFDELLSNTPSDDELRSLVSKVSSTFDEDSDEDLPLFSIPLPTHNVAPSSPVYASPVPRQTLMNHKLQGKSQQDEETPVLAMKSKGAQKRKMFLEKENRKKQTPIMNTRSKFAKSAKSTKTKLCNDTRYSHELCASLDCSHPKEAKNTWVQCEDCDDWYHLQCAGLKAKDAKKRNTVYHCGCN